MRKKFQKLGNLRMALGTRHYTFVAFVVALGSRSCSEGFSPGPSGIDQSS